MLNAVKDGAITWILKFANLLGAKLKTFYFFRESRRWVKNGLWLLLVSKEREMPILSKIGSMLSLKK
jgi:hypothetical protein